jgi:hypothetical protein
MNTSRLVKIAQVRRVARRCAFLSTSKRDIGNFKMDKRPWKGASIWNETSMGPLP